MTIVWILIMVFCLGYTLKRKMSERAKRIKERVESDIFIEKSEEALNKLLAYIDVDLETEMRNRMFEIRKAKSINEAPELIEVYHYLACRTSITTEGEFLAAMDAAGLILPTLMLRHGKVNREFIANGVAAYVSRDTIDYVRPKAAAGLRRRNVKDGCRDISDRLNEFLWNYMIWYESQLKEKDIQLEICSAKCGFFHSTEDFKERFLLGDEKVTTPADTKLYNSFDDDAPMIRYWIWESRFIQFECLYQKPWNVLNRYIQSHKTDNAEVQ